MGHYCADCQEFGDSCTCTSPIEPTLKLEVGCMVRRVYDTHFLSWCNYLELNQCTDTQDAFEVTKAAGSYIRLKGSDRTFLASNFEVVDPKSIGKSSGGRRDAQIATFAATYTGGSSDYYKVTVSNTTTPYALSYTAECNDIIEALGMNFAEGNAFKALWRRAAQRTLGLRKAGAKDDGLYDAEKVEFFGKRLVEQSKALKDGTS